MIDNFKQISELMTFPDEDNFYFVQILQRKKDQPEKRQEEEKVIHEIQ